MCSYLQQTESRIRKTSKTHRLRRYRITTNNPPISLPQSSAKFNLSLFWAFWNTLVLEVTSANHFLTNMYYYKRARIGSDSKESKQNMQSLSNTERADPLEYLNWSNFRRDSISRKTYIFEWIKLLPFHPGPHVQSPLSGSHWAPFRQGQSLPQSSPQRPGGQAVEEKERKRAGKLLIFEF